MKTNVRPTIVSVISLFCGKKDPTSAQLFEHFVDELNELIRLGCKGSTVRVKYFVCDMPAAALAKGILGHGGYHGCPKCTQLAENVGRMPLVWPLKLNKVLRTDADFRSRKDLDHHGPAGRPHPRSPIEGK